MLEQIMMGRTELMLGRDAPRHLPFIQRLACVTLCVVTQMQSSGGGTTTITIKKRKVKKHTWIEQKLVLFLNTTRHEQAHYSLLLPCDTG